MLLVPPACRQQLLCTVSACDMSVGAGPCYEQFPCTCCSVFRHELKLQTVDLGPFAVVMDDNLKRLHAERDQLKRSWKDVAKVLKLEAGQS